MKSQRTTIVVRGGTSPWTEESSMAPHLLFWNSKWSDIVYRSVECLVGSADRTLDAHAQGRNVHNTQLVGFSLQSRLVSNDLLHHTCGACWRTCKGKPTLIITQRLRQCAYATTRVRPCCNCSLCMPTAAPVQHSASRCSDVDSSSIVNQEVPPPRPVITIHVSAPH
jgi:hypothetical protein